MIWAVIDVLLAIFDLYVIASFYFRRLHSRVNRTQLLMTLIAFGAITYCLRLCNIPELPIIILSVAICFGMTLLFTASWKQRLFYPLVLVSLEIIAEITAGLLLTGISEMSVKNITADRHSAEFLIGLVTAKLIFFFFVRVLSRLHVINDNTLPISHWVAVMLVPGMSIAVNLGLAIASSNYIMHDPLAPFLILIGILAINVLVFVLYDELSAQSKTLLQSERQKYRMEADIRQCGIIIEQSKEVASLLHDASKHAEQIRSLLLEGDHAAALSYVSGLLAFSDVRMDRIVPNNHTIDSILRRKLYEAEQHGISVNHSVSLPSGLQLNDICLCVILGNALDNALEACDKLPEGEHRNIDINILYHDNRLTIRIANTSKSVEIIDNVCDTKKTNKMLHGHGLSNIRRTVTENGGNATIRYESGRFILSVIFLL